MGLRIAVCVKQVLDPRVPLQIVEEDNLVEQSGPQPVYLMNPADRCALEEGMSLKQGLGAEVVAITVGPNRAEEALRLCLARGADRGVHILCPAGRPWDAWATTLVLCEAIRKQSYDLVLCGDKSLDYGGGQVGPALAELLDLPQVTRVIAMEVAAGHQRVIAQRLLERGDREIVECPLPALISVTALGRQPCYVSVHRGLLVRDHLLEKHDISSLLPVSPEPLCKKVSVGWPRLRPKTIATPDTTSPAAERMNFLLSGGRSKNKDGLFEGSAEGAVNLVVQFLAERGFL